MTYERWGFSSSPFQTTSLPSSDLGRRLLVGRDSELESLVRKITSPPKLATLEGLNGVGKTSIVNVACFQLFSKYLETGDGPMYIPCRRVFQLSPQQDLQSFVDLVLMEVAQTLIEKGNEIKQHPKRFMGAQLNTWLNSPQLVNLQGGLFGFQGGYQAENNASAGFERSGLRKVVTTWLETLFPNPESGGVICTIDNLELLQSSDVARQQLEQLRDELFNTKGLRWVLCGALGIVYGIVASPRLEGYLHKPIEIGDIGSQHAAAILTGRMAAFATEGRKPYLPLLPEDFAQIYAILRGNLRSVLSYADDFCQWIADQTEPPTSNDEKHSMFIQWLNEQTEAAYQAVRQELRPKAVEVFQVAIRLGGVFSPSDFEDFGFNSIPAFRPHIRDLEGVGLLVSTKDDGDKRRKTIQVTPKGWIVHFHMARST